MQIKRIAIFQLDNYEYSPFSRNLFNFAPEFINRGIALDLITSSSSGMNNLPDNVSGYVIGRRWPKMRLIPRHYLGIPDLVRFIRDNKPDVLLARGLAFAIPAIFAAKLAGEKTKIVMTLHVALSNDIQKRTHRSWFLMPYLARFAINSCAATVAVSKGVANDYADLARVQLQKINVVYNPVVNLALLECAKLPIDDPWFDEDRKHKTLLAVGRLAPEKDYPTLFKALAILRKSEDVRLLIIGDGALRDSLTALVESLDLTDAVRFVGRKENPYAYMSKADALVLTSQFEGLPGVLIQALAVGCPVVSTDAVSGPREILEAGKWGPLCPVGDFACVAKAIKSVLTKPISRDELQQRGAFFNATRYANDMLKLFVNEH